MTVIDELRHDGICLGERRVARWQPGTCGSSSDAGGMAGSTKRASWRLAGQRRRGI